MKDESDEKSIIEMESVMSSEVSFVNR